MKKYNKIGLLLVILCFLCGCFIPYYRNVQGPLDLILFCFSPGIMIMFAIYGKIKKETEQPLITSIITFGLLGFFIFMFGGFVSVWITGV